MGQGKYQALPVILINLFMSPPSLSALIKTEAHRLGFSACGIARADRVAPSVEENLRSWLEKGMNADMAWMENYLDKRLDPRLLMRGLRSIVCVAMNYAPARQLPEGQPQIAAYALGQDYHDVVKLRLRLLGTFAVEERRRLKALSEEDSGQNGGDFLKEKSVLNDVPAPQNQQKAEEIQEPFRVFVDSGPVLERYWAVQAGLGWIGKNRQLIIPRAGSMFFLGELFLPFELDYDRPIASRCGTCSRCIDACPTHALSEKQTNGTTEQQPFNAELCLSYQTIENRGAISTEARRAIGNVIYGCDRCQQACPWNKFATPTDVPELQPREELLQMTREKWNHLTIEQYQRLFKGSAVKRVKYNGLMRNIAASGANDPE